MHSLCQVVGVEGGGGGMGCIEVGMLGWGTRGWGRWCEWLWAAGQGTVVLGIARGAGWKRIQDGIECRGGHLRV
ncbi:hypothetical protein F751_3694 [Auxenochlorella protothecoides]|uniref:Uncharacterized protein n=1 Tax=Auxenochlorella protothecoides TaxID=3075 RepID=A0A087STM3_AUXPR|nr:hypothetical protein F751_3694 [Auxenochlorella protothecoides]KFM29077.1 hypothetical protein F751_3694 [Auxenochlorella protothecoides]